VHAGLYYPEGSWKARLCVAGRKQLSARCVRLGIPYRQIGKLVVANSTDEVATLERIRALGTANGAPDLALLDGEAVRRLEPAVRAVAALHSPATGIVDAHALCVSWLAEAEAHGAALALRHEVVSLEHDGASWCIEAIEPDGARATLSCAAVVNAAGLDSDRVAALAGIDLDAQGWRQHPCKGDWFALAPSAPLRLQRLVYPVPSGAGLGIHVTLDLAGRMRFGPDVEWIDEENYDVNASRAASFYGAIRRYWPALKDNMLQPDYAGIRPKLTGPGEPAADFMIEGPAQHGLPGLTHLFGIESPGLTASLSLAEAVTAHLDS
jgi:L-2-hydroxyglutarate oxidase LhgO